MSVEFWKSLFDVAAVVLLFLTFAAGAGVLITGNIINKRQDVKLRKFDSDLTKAKSDVASQESRAAALEIEAADAKSAQQQVQIELAKQQTITANAEKDLATLRERIQPRLISPRQRALVLLCYKKPRKQQGQRGRDLARCVAI